MKLHKIFIAVVLVSTQCIHGQHKKFKVVLDAGHGGKDFGAVYNGNVEKNIALKTVLKVGALLEKQQDIEVVYTRNTDKFVELDDRASVANKSKASLFVSIHCNANEDPSASGNETYVMGITRNASNLEVAKKENAVVTLESDYKIKYEGYDPKSPESIIGISILQEEHLNQSIELAGRVQQAFTKKSKYKNRGVKQAGFLVLRKIAMPRVLIEMGFVSNKAEGAFLNSEDGQNKLAEAISTAIIDYKKEYFKKSETHEKKGENEEIKKIEPDQKPILEPNETISKKEKEKKIEKTKDGIVFKIQISASNRKLETKPSNFKGLKNITRVDGKNFYKYFYQNTTSYESAKKYLEEAKAKSYTSAFIVAYQNEKEIPLKEAIK